MTRDDNIFMAKICEQSERFQDMVHYIKLVAETDQEFTTEERNLLTVAYKNHIGPNRTSWRTLSLIEMKHESKLIQKSESSQLPLIKDYKIKIEKELYNSCQDIIGLLDACLIPKSQGRNDQSVFYLKMKGDYYRYIAEYATGDKHHKATDSALDAYERSKEIAMINLKPTHPIRLGLALNNSVFHYEVMNFPTRACQLAKTAYDEAIADIDQLEDENYKDSTTIMQLIRDNLTLWTSELEQDDHSLDNK